MSGIISHESGAFLLQYWKKPESLSIMVSEEVAPAYIPTCMLSLSEVPFFLSKEIISSAAF